MPTAWRARSSLAPGRSPRERSAAPAAADVRRMTFDDNALLAVLYGNHDRHLVRIEQLANVQLSARGNQLAIAGAPEMPRSRTRPSPASTSGLKRGLSIEMADIDAAVRFARTGADGRRGEHPHPPAHRAGAHARPARLPGGPARARHGVRPGARRQRQDLSRRRHGRVAADRPARSSASCCRGRRSRPASGWASCPAT